MTTRSITVGDGKYEVQFDEKTANLSSLRNGEPWREMAGDNLAFAMFTRIEELEQQLKDQRERHDMIQDALAADLDKRDTGTVRATIAAVLEAIERDMRESGKPELVGSPYVEVSLDAQRTIWDRVELLSQLISLEGGGHNVKFTLMFKNRLQDSTNV